LAFYLAVGPAARARPNFPSSEIEGNAADLIFCDLDGDRLKDAVLVDGLNLSIYFQDPRQGFPRKPQQQYRLDNRPSVIWPAKLAGKSESLLIMTSQGVDELTFANRTNPPVRRQIIQQPTIIPDVSDQSPGTNDSKVVYLPLLAESGTNPPMLFVPASDGLQIWQLHEAWKQIQLIPNAARTHIRPSLAPPGYTRSFGLNFSVSDINGDGREDLILMQGDDARFLTYSLYLKQPDGRFTDEPVMTYTNKADWRSSLCWIDVNRDGKLDLIKGTFLDEPSFLPGIPSGKVLIGTYLADGQGRIPAESQQVFRKNDWTSALPVVDVAGNGYVDLVLGYVPINTREGFRKMITAEQVDFTLKIHCFHPGAGASFSKDPDFQRGVFIHVGREFITSFDHSLDFAQFINVTGDFNGDGKRDLLVRDHVDSIAAYYFISREKGFSTEADFRFRCSGPISWFETKDLNGDGVSDLIVKLAKQNVLRIFLSQGTK